MRGWRGTLLSLRMDRCRWARRPAQARGRTAGHERDPDTHQLRAHTTTVDGEEQRISRPTVPLFLNVDEAAELLRTTRRAIYAMVERRQLPGVVQLLSPRPVSLGRLARLAGPEVHAIAEGVRR